LPDIDFQLTSSERLDEETYSRGGTNDFGTILLSGFTEYRSDTKDYDDLPLVYSCSGCVSAVQMANDLVVKLHREQHAEMSCIAGVGGDVDPLVETAPAGRPMLVIDGCPLECAHKTSKITT